MEYKSYISQTANGFLHKKQHKDIEIKTNTCKHENPNTYNLTQEVFL